MSGAEQVAKDSNSERSRIESELSTMFILDMMRQKKEKLMRLKKDELINEMARKQREKMAMERAGTFVCDGTGFRGVQYFENQQQKKPSKVQPWSRKT